MPSLLYTLVRRRLGIQLEPALTDGLAHVVREPAVSRRFLSGLLSGVEGVPAEVMGAELRPQVGDRTTRPDLVGVAGGREQLFIEGKLWAGLTEGQRGRYLERLRAAHASSGANGEFAGLILFVAPTARLRRLWSDLSRELALGTASVAGPVRFALHRPEMTAAGDTPPVLVVALCGWTEALAAAESALLGAGDEGQLPSATIGQLAGDLTQLRGLIQESEADAFQPLTVEEATDLEWPRRWHQLTQLPQDVIAVAQARGVLRSGTGTSAWAAANGRKVHINDWEFLLLCDAGRWVELQDGPLWLWRDGSYRLTPYVRERLGPGTQWGGRDDRTGTFCVPLPLAAGASRDELVDAVVDHLTGIAAALGPPPARS